MWHKVLPWPAPHHGPGLGAQLQRKIRVTKQKRPSVRASRSSCLVQASYCTVRYLALSLCNIGTHATHATCDFKTACEACCMLLWICCKQMVDAWAVRPAKEGIRPDSPYQSSSKGASRLPSHKSTRPRESRTL